MRIRWFLLSCLLACSQLVAAEDGIYLELGDQPNRSVKLINNSATELVMDMTGDDEIIEKNRQRGINFPFRLSIYKNQIFTTTTGKRDNDGGISFVRAFVDSSSYSEDKDGNRLSIPDSMGDLVGMQVNGVFDATGRAKLMSLAGRELSSEKEQLIRTVFASSLAAFSTTPVGPLKIGDSFSQQTPFTFPVAGQQPIQLNCNTTYTLKQIIGKMAYLDIAMTFNMTSSASGAKIEFNGSGAGTMEYNLDTKLQKQHTLAIDMDMKLHGGKATITSKMKSSSTTQQLITGDGGQS